MTLEEKIAQVRINGFPLTKDQTKGIMKMARWLEEAKSQRFTYCRNDGSMGVAKPPVFRIAGLAGCGKTSMSIAVKSIGFKPLYVSFTNRAVGVLASKGCFPCKTVHSILYDCLNGDEELSPELIRAQQEYLSAVEAGVPPAQRPPLPPSRSKVGWERKDFALLQEAVAGHDCIVVDEASMVGRRMGEDLEFIGLPIIGIGDFLGQLPPVGDLPYFNPRSPDVSLTEVLRTDGDILDLAAWVRRGGRFSNAAPGKDYEIRRKAAPEWFHEADQVMCGIHAKRKELNRHIRKLRGFTSMLPEVGDKVMGVANNKELGIYNGALWTVLSSEMDGDYVVMDLEEFAPTKAKEDLEHVFQIPVHASCFIQDIRNKEEFPLQGMRYDSALMTWGWCITVHKAQGSEWPVILVFDDGDVFREDARRWKYTGVTRAAKKAYIVSRS